MSEHYTSKLMQELSQAASLIQQEDIHQLSEQIVQAPKVFLAGAGRSGLMMKGFAMRLIHLGISAYVVGETTTPSFSERDLLLIGSGSGETSSLLASAQKAKKLGGVLGAVTLNPQSTIGTLADYTVKLSGSPKDTTASESQSIQPMGSLYEQTLLIFLDSVVLSLMEKLNMNGQDMYTRHANLE